MSDPSVECYAGYQADERPVRFTLGERVFSVITVERQWRDIEALYFRVRADDGNLYVLRRDTGTGSWHLAGFGDSRLAVAARGLPRVRPKRGTRAS